MSEGADLAAEIAAALAEAGAAVGNGRPVHTLRKPGSGGPTSPHDDTPEPDPTLHELVGIEKTRQIRDASGTLIGQSVRTITVGATGVEPKKGEQIAPWTTPDDVTAQTNFEVIAEVRVKMLGGVPLKYDLDLEG